MHAVQPNAGPVLETKRVYYKDSSTGALQPGYVLCYDLSAPSTPAAGTFDEEVIGIRCVRPATANLHAVAGVVLTPPRVVKDAANSDYSGFCEVIVPQKGNVISVYTKQNMTAGTTPLAPQNGQFYLADDTKFDDTNSRPSIHTVGIAAETADTSTTAANKLVACV